MDIGLLPPCQRDLSRNDGGLNFGVKQGILVLIEPFCEFSVNSVDELSDRGQ